MKQAKPVKKVTPKQSLNNQQTTTYKYLNNLRSAQWQVEKNKMVLAKTKNFINQFGDKVKGLKTIK